MLCLVAHITKDDIGAIRVQAKETYVELASGCAEFFLDALGPDAKLENNISVTRLNGAPNLQRENRSTTSDKPRPPKKPYTSEKPVAQDFSKPKRTFIKKADDTSAGKKPWDKAAKKPKGNKNKPSAAKAGTKYSGPERSGQASLKRKKPKKQKTG